MTDERALLIRTAELAAQYLDTLATRPIRPDADYATMIKALDGPVPEEGMDPLALVDELAAVAEPGLTAMGSGRYFGFVIGGALPASLAADWLVSAWDQNAGLAQPTPAVSALEAVTGRWVLELLGLPAHSSFAFVTGCQMAHVTSLAAARQAVYERIGYDLREQGLAGAPPLRVVVGEKRHVTLTRALRLLGIGRAQELVVPVDDQGRMRAELLEGVARRCRAAADRLRAGRRGEHRARSTTSRRSSRSPTRTDAWVHVDGAFGLWAAASPRLAHLVAGHAAADSWATDAHKWLNVPYDCGIAICAHPAMHAAAMEYAAPYLAVGGEAERDPMGYSPEFSRRARSLPAWAAIRSLGRRGLAEHDRGELRQRRSRSPRASRRCPAARSSTTSCSTRCCCASRPTSGRAAIVAAVQQEGEAWMSPTVWEGRAAIRISVSCWRTNADDVRRTIDAFARAVARLTTAAQSSAASSAARSASSLTTDGSASVVVSPIARFSATSRSRRRMILPERVFGSSGVKTMLAGFAIAPILFATWLRSSSSISTDGPSLPFSVT